MRAIVRDAYGSADVLRCEEVATPEPGPGEVLVKVVAASINTADTDLMRGSPPVARLATGLSKPRTRRLGLDAAGRVESVGAGVTGLRPGDEVWADLYSSGLGAFAEYVCAGEAAFVPKPPGVSFEDAATLPHSGVLALQGLGGKGRPQQGQSVLINGAGGCVGPFAVQIAKSWGLKVTAVDSGGKLEMLRSIGADRVVDFTIQNVLEIGQRYDLILDIAATRSVLRFRPLLEPGGAYVQIARTLRGFFAAAVLGSLVSLASKRRMGVFNWVPNRREDLDLLADLVVAGELRPVVDRTCELEKVPDAIRAFQAGETRGKVVVLP